MPSNVLFYAQDVADLIAALETSSHPRAGEFRNACQSWQSEGGEEREKLVALAREEWDESNDDIAIDGTPCVSISEDGTDSVAAWVQAWVYVRIPVENEEETERKE